MTERFTPPYSDAARAHEQIKTMREQVKSMREALAAEWLRAKEAEEKAERMEKENRELLDKLLKVEFEARVAKGCYSRCPVGRLRTFVESTSGAA